MGPELTDNRAPLRGSLPEGSSRCLPCVCGFSSRSWVAYDGEDFSGNQYVLEEGHYPCPSAMGCPPGAVFKSLRFIHVVSMSVSAATGLGGAPADRHPEETRGSLTRCLTLGRCSFPSWNV